MPSHQKNIYQLDTRGLNCPEPVMMLHGVVRDASSGDTIVVYATDPSSERDIEKFCRFLGHRLLSLDKKEDELIFVLEKG